MMKQLFGEGIYNRDRMRKLFDADHIVFGQV